MMLLALMKNNDGSYRLAINDVELILTKQDLVELTGGLYQLTWKELS